MEAVAASRPRGRRLTNVLERPGVLASVLISPAVLFVLLLVGGPLLIAIGLSFTNATSGQLHGKWVGLENFRNEWGNPAFQHAVWHTFLFTVISQAVVLVVAGLLAHALTKDFRGKWLLRFVILLPWAAPIALSLMVWKWMFDTSYSIFNWTLVHLHLYGPLEVPQYLAQPKLAMASVITVHAWRIIPFAIVIFLAGLASIPKEVDDAAAIDGATGLQEVLVRRPCRCSCRSRSVALLFGIVFTATDMAIVYILTQRRAVQLLQHADADDLVVQDRDRVGLARRGRGDLSLPAPGARRREHRDAAVRAAGGGRRETADSGALRIAIVGPFAIVLAFPFYVDGDHGVQEPDGASTTRVSRRTGSAQHSPTWDNASYLFHHTQYLRWLANTAIVGVCVVAITLVLAVARGLRARSARGTRRARASASASSSPTSSRRRCSSCRCRA